MDFKEYQEKAVSTAIYPRVFVEREDGGLEEATYIYPALGLGGEGGETLEKVKKLVRDNRGVVTPEARDAVKKELGDQLWYIAALCKEFGISMEDVAKTNIEKLAARKAAGKLGGSGDNRETFKQ